MRTIFFILTQIIYHSSEKTRLDVQSMQINLFVVQSLQFIIKEFFLKVTTSFVITISCRYDHTFHFFKLIMEQLLHSTDNMVMQLVLVQSGEPAKVPGPRRYNLYFVDSLQAFLDVDPVQYSANYNINEYYYIFLQQMDENLPEDLQGILSYCWRNYLLNCNVQIQNRHGNILLYTYFPFTQEYCGGDKPVFINEFIGPHMLHAEIFPKKLSNFHQCHLRVATWNTPPFLKLQRLGDDTPIIGGFEGLLLLEFARRLNFSIEIVHLFDNKLLAFGNLTIGDYIEAALGKLQNRTADMALGYLRENSERNRLVTSLSAHYQVLQVLSVLGGAEAYTSLEILGFPFHINTWYILILTLLCGLVSVRLYRTAKTTAMINFVSVTMGMSTTTMPHRLHERIIYINWTLCSFILRSIYIALLYDLFCMNLYRPPPNSLAELIRANYTIVMNEDVHIGVSGITQLNDERLHLKLIDSIEETAAFVHLERNAHRKLAAMGAMEVLLHYGREHGTPGLFYILPEAVMHQPLTIYLTKHSFLTEQLNTCLQRIHASGLMEYWLRSELDVRYFRRRPATKQKYIGQTELNGIYFICAGLTCLALVLFLLEICASKLSF